MNVGSEGGGKKGEAELDFELNLAPIIDCFTVLITFMLVSASFLSVSILEASVAAVEAAPTETPQDNSTTVSLELRQTGDFEIKLNGEVTETIPVPKAADGSHTRILSERLDAIHIKFPKITTLSLSADHPVEYRDVVKAMELARKSFPSVILGGF